MTYAPPAGHDAGAPIVAFVGRTTAVEKDFPRFTRIARRLSDRGARVWIADPHDADWEQFERTPVERIDDGAMGAGVARARSPTSIARSPRRTAWC